jgi:sugar (pentulose or hexulose) kinase
VSAFDAYFQSLGNSPMSRFERAILKTYLLARLTGQFVSDPPHARTSQPTGC